MAKIIEGQNSAKEDEVKGYVEKIEALDAEKLREQMTFMERARRIEEQKKSVYDDAKARGVAKKPLKVKVKVRALERKIADAQEDLEDDDRATYEQISKALGDFADTGLGQAAAAKGKGAPKQDATTAAIVDAVKADMTDSEWEKAAPVH
jgi:uncharacterized protein (UPF0335 family)